MTPETGDVVEIEMDGKYCYARVLRVHPTYREILALSPTGFASPCDDGARLRFSEVVIFPLGSALRSGRITGRVRPDLSDAPHRPLPRFKFAVRDGAGSPVYWWLWDGDTIEIAGSDDDLDALPERKMTSLAELRAFWN